MSTIASSAAVPRGARAARPPARWAVVAAHLAPLVTLPSSLWRLPLVFGATNGALNDGRPLEISGWENLYVLALSLVAESVALLTIGLVRPWGERAPRWMPFIGGRTVPAGPVVAVALTGAAALTYIWTSAVVAFFGDDFLGGFTSRGWEALMVACYAPLVLWGPLVAAVTFDYWRRRR